MKTILYITNILDRGGAEIMLYDIVKNISQKFRIFILIHYEQKDPENKKGVLDDAFEKHGCTLLYIPSQKAGISLYFKNLRAISNQIGQIDIVHSHINVRSGIPAYFFRKKGVKTYITHSHGVFLSTPFSVKSVATRIHYHFQRYLINKHSTNFWACSDKAVDYLFSEKNRRQAVIINNAIETDKFLHPDTENINAIKKKLNSSHYDLIIGSVGRIVPYKNLDFVIDVLRELDKKRINFLFINVGKIIDKAYFQKVLKKVEEYNLNSRFHHIGLKSNVEDYYNIINVFMAPSINEPFGMVALEAQASNCFCLLGNLPKEVDMGLDKVLFLKDFNSKEWADKIGIANLDKNDPEYIKSAFVTRGFDSEKNTKIIEEYYHRFVQSSLNFSAR